MPVMTSLMVIKCNASGSILYRSSVLNFRNPLPHDDELKGWYCNVSRLAVLDADDRLSYMDLALDL